MHTYNPYVSAFDEVRVAGTQLLETIRKMHALQPPSWAVFSGRSILAPEGAALAGIIRWDRDNLSQCWIGLYFNPRYPHVRDAEAERQLGRLMRRRLRAVARAMGAKPLADVTVQPSSSHLIIDLRAPDPIQRCIQNYKQMLAHHEEQLLSGMRAFTDGFPD